MSNKTHVKTTKVYGLDDVLFGGCHYETHICDGDGKNRVDASANTAEESFERASERYIANKLSEK